jgi:hypothetical protein
MLPCRRLSHSYDTTLFRKCLIIKMALKGRDWTFPKSLVRKALRFS